MKRQFQIAACVMLCALLPNTMRAAAYAVAGEQVNLNGFNLLCDSFDSTDTNRSTDGHYDSAKRGDAAYVGLIRGIVNGND